MADLLEVRDLVVRHGPVAVLAEVDLAVPEGAVVGLIGPNGAGKTTFIDAVTGFVPTAAGTVRLDDIDLTRAPAHRRARAGLTRTFQSLELFDDLTVRDNVLVAASQRRWWHLLRDVVAPSRGGRTEGVDAALDQVGLAWAAHRLPSELSHGQRLTLGLARALVTRPRLVLLDEPAAGLDPAETEALGLTLRTLPERGTGVVLVDHDMSLVLNVCDRVDVIDFGRIIASGPPATIRTDPAVIAAYLGESA